MRTGQDNRGRRKLKEDTKFVSSFNLRLCLDECAQGKALLAFDKPSRGTTERSEEETKYASENFDLLKLRSNLHKSEFSASMSGPFSARCSGEEQNP